MTKYVYHSEKTKTTCYECSKNDGKVFHDIKEVPKLPIHPNCKCYIETIEETSNSNDECNCKDRMEILRNNVSNILLNADNLDKDIEKELLECAITFKDNQESNEYETIKNNYFAIEDSIQELIKSTNDLSTDIDILKEYNYDPFYHTKEECGMNDGLIELNNSLTNLFNKLNTISQNIKYLKEKRITAQKQFEEKAKEEEKAAERLKGGTPTGAAAGVKNDKKSKEEKAVDEGLMKIHLTQIPVVGKVGATIKGGPDAAGMINISEGKNVPIYTKDAVKIDNIGDSKFDDFNDGDLKKWKYDFAKKIDKQFKQFNLTGENIEGYIFKNNSDPVKRIKESKEFKRILAEKKAAILSGKDFSGGFNADADWNLGNAFGNVDFKNKGFDKEGNLHLYMFDTYDFNPNEGGLIEAGRRLMMSGELKGFFSIHDIVIPKNQINSILNIKN